YASGHPVRAGRRAAPRPHVGAEPLVHAHHESTHVLESYAGHWAVVTGASSGIGAEFVRQLAARGMHCVLVARREDRLREVAREIESAHGTRCEIVTADLSQPHAGRELLAEVNRRGIAMELLVNNAGFGLVSSVEETDVGRALDLIQVNVACVTELTLLAAQEMVARGHGGIINIGSVVSFQPVGYMGVYSASKAYVLHFSESLWAELRPHGVTVTTLCPGTTRTEFFDHSGVPGWAEQNRGQDVETVVRTGLKAFDAGRHYVVSGWKNYLLSLAVRLATRATVVQGSMAVFRPRAEKPG
ncbi:MAG: SDR family NAD(P)-dependent oxidoreductase, partial [Planctomycetia bacterium]